MNVLAGAYALEGARRAGVAVEEDPAVHGVYPCSGDDEWCVISLCSQSDRRALAGLLDLVELPSDPAELDAVICAWTEKRTNADVVDAAQGAGIAAASMYRALDVLGDAQVCTRELYTDLVHPLFDDPMPSETAPTRYRNIAPAALTPAPQAGQQTREICCGVLGLTSTEVDQLLADGVLFESRV